MKSKRVGTGTSDVEVTHISAHGIWVYVRGSEHFLPYEDFPWFRQAKIQEVLHVELNHGSHLHWPELDVDLSVDSLDNPGRYPLVAES